MSPADDISIDVTAAVVVGLAAKLETLDLASPERAALEAILERAERTDTEVEGFGTSLRPDFLADDHVEKRELTDLSRRLGQILGFPIGASRYIGETEKNLR